MHQYVDKRKKLTSDITAKLDQGRRDWKELFRDASVFEFNFAKHENYKLRDEIDAMQEEIVQKRTEFEKHIKSDP